MTRWKRGDVERRNVCWVLLMPWFLAIEPGVPSVPLTLPSWPQVLSVASRTWSCA